MGNAVSAAGSAAKRAFENIRNAFRREKMEPNPTMSQLEVLINKRAPERKPKTADESTAAEYYSERLWQERMNARETMRRTGWAEQADDKAEQLWKERMDGREALRRARREQLRAEERHVAADKAARQAEQRQQRPIRPVKVPSEEEYEAAKQLLQYEEGYIHFAIAGVAGSGKSSLLNAFLGRRNADRGAAPAGTSETTKEITRYADPNLDNPFVWYDVPGAGTLSIPGWQYFSDQALYVFDAIIVLFDNRFTETDIAILKNSERFNIPTYIVRSKALQHVRNVMTDISPSDYADDAGRAGRDVRGLPLWYAARDKFVQDTRSTVRKNLEDADLPAQRAYIVDKDYLRPIIRGQREPSPDDFDEWKLLRDILDEARRRRVVEDLES